MHRGRFGARLEEDLLDADTKQLFRTEDVNTLE
jgi:hypothetical protein